MASTDLVGAQTRRPCYGPEKIARENSDTKKQELFSQEAERLRPQLVTFVEKLIRHPSDAEDIVQQTLVELWTSGAYLQITAPGRDAEDFLRAAVELRLKGYFRSKQRARQLLINEAELEDTLGNREWADQTDLASPIRTLPAPELLTHVTGRAKGQRRLFYFAVFEQSHRIQEREESRRAVRIDIDHALNDLAFPDIAITVLSARVLENHDWRDVAEKIGYEVSIVRKLFQTACYQLAGEERLSAYRSDLVAARRRWKRCVKAPKTLRVDCPFCWLVDTGVRPFFCSRCMTAIGRGAEPAFTLATATSLRFVRKALLDLHDQFRARLNLQERKPL